MRRNLLGMLVLAVSITCAAPSGAAAQQLQEDGGDGGACTYACGCNEAACTCSRTGGRGGACRTDGNVCSVFKCVASVLPEGSVLAYAADGSLVVMPGQRSDAASRPELPLTIQAVRWSVAAPGHLMGLGCGDVIAAEFFDAEAAASSRERMRSITL